jgi:hypothetical protein
MADIYLRHFSGDEVKISKEQASLVLRFFFPDQSVSPNETDEDTAFAQALLLEAIDKSNDEGYIEILFRQLYGKVPTDFSFIKDVAKEFCKRALKNWFNHATGKDLENPEIYENVRAQIRRNFRSVWTIRVQTGELIY